VEVVASLSQGRTAAAQCGLFTHKSVPVIFEPPCRTPGSLEHSRVYRSYTQHYHVRTHRTHCCEEWQFNWPPIAVMFILQQS